MQQLSLEIYRRTCHGVLLFGVLTGLLFSCGEGIRLFPFPEAERTAGIEFSRKSEEKILYQKNVRRFETRQENQAKSQRDNSHRYRVSVHPAPSDSPFILSRLSATLLVIGSRPRFQSAKSFERIGSSGGSRAPPVSESL
jgi:hypothetical protein